MVEHLLSALAAMEITDAEIEVEGPELPILDGSAKDYLDRLKAAGSEALGSQRRVHIFSRVNVQGENEERIGVSAGSGRWRFDWARPGYWPGDISFEAQLPEDYEQEIAPARTFCHESDIPMIQAAGLGKGGNEHNTLVIGDGGYLTEHRFANEPARHKMLDLIGDLMLSRVPPRFLNVVGERSGHSLNVAAASRLAEVCTWED
jgi:UDP-3-O-acyl-N-acetylglucosamine deacetylase